MRGLLALTGGILVALAGCAQRQPPPPLQPHGARFTVGHHVGQPLSGPALLPVPMVSAADSLRVHLTTVALEQMPTSVGERLAGQANVIVSLRDARPIAPTASLIQMARLAPVEDSATFVTELLNERFGRAASMGEADAALPVGVTATFTLREPAGADPTVPRRRLELSFFRVGRELHVTVLIGERVQLRTERVLPQDSGSPDAARAPATAPAEPSYVQTELARIVRPLANGRDRFAIFVPLRLGDSEPHAIAVVVESSPPSPGAPHQALVDRCIANLREAFTAMSTRPVVGPLSLPQWPAISAAMAALPDPARSRSALVFLAEQTGADFCMDLALAADDAALRRIADAALTVGRSVRDPAGLGWTIDRVCLDHAAKLLADGKLPREMSAVLIRHAGEVGRQAWSIGEVLKDAPGRDEFRRRLIAENLIYLEDGSPASRVRAFDWLASRGLAPTGFDPLGPPRERRKALERASNAPAGGGKTP